ncbi:MAG: purine-nucleoside phosphorylase [Tidjanibacter sp.]|nr:purine-nucleoside phosphorylase [Tidjanibacter sp.]MBQ1964846.1 purine-nucleoside phosphorylase [Tidjanibacter sp.]MBQ5807667.1 purine-nucleoside phosphorylase [Tidjanibacter sp.]MBQ5931771.1 purine-nucleoside phosphorylase [Tidjanibacter sp.]
MIEQIKASANYIKEKVAGFEPEVGIILGTGLGGLVNHIEIAHSIPYNEIPAFPVSTVEGHAGRLIFGTLGGKKVVAMQGRFHYYEGYATSQVVFPVRVMKFLGIQTLFVSNASGGINSSFRVGDLMVITDHINLIPNVLIGTNCPELGARFPDMSEPYSKALDALATEVAAEKGIKLQYGCYVGTTGPTFETPKEYGYFKAIGGDAAGMSTTPEVIAARHMGLPVFGISIITNAAFSGQKSTHEEVQQEGAKAEKRMSALIIGMLEKM